VRAWAAKPDISNVEAFRRTLIEAKSIAYSDSVSGIYLSTTLFTKLGVADQVAGKSRKVRGPPSGEPVAAVVARGEAEIGFQQVSELLHVEGRYVCRRDSSRAAAGNLFFGRDRHAVRHPEAAEALIRFLASPEAVEAISKAGLVPVLQR
jgi:molybdate transport system substrate-binding protein